MPTADTRLTIPVLLGSVRRDRQGIRAARLIFNALTERGHEPVLVDPLELQLPLLDRMYKEHPKGEAPAQLEQLATLYRRADGFMIVSAEYNNGIPPALKNLLDHFLEEYFWRPSLALDRRITLAGYELPGTLRRLFRRFLSHSGDFGWFCRAFVLLELKVLKYKNPVLRGFFMVGARGFEPPTPSLPD